MRGKQEPFDGLGGAVRIIPAHAGQTHRGWLENWTTTDHPRACGANGSYSGCESSKSGSSPRMRGKHLDWNRSDLAFRIIPAHAGQTWSTELDSPLRSDHPRACGANITLSDMSGVPYGSSPRMRGKLFFSIRPATVFRIIPAHAGQTCVSGFCSGGLSDHPRACGANLSIRWNKTIVDGSSPRMRGKQQGALRARDARRIIPAHAGQTSVGLL